MFYPRFAHLQLGPREIHRIARRPRVALRIELTAAAAVAHRATTGARRRIRQRTGAVERPLRAADRETAGAQTVQIGGDVFGAAAQQHSCRRGGFRRARRRRNIAVIAEVSQRCGRSEAALPGADERRRLCGGWRHGDHLFRVLVNGVIVLLFERHAAALLVGGAL